MGRPKTPTKVLETKGSFKDQPGRKKKRAGEPIVSTPIGAPPKHLKPDAKKAWKEIVDKAPDGVLTSADELSVEMASLLIAKMRKNMSELVPAEMTRLQSLLGHFGMTPSHRAGMNIPKPDDDINPFDELD